MKKWLILLIVTVFWAVNAQATIRTDVIDYKHGDTILEGYLAYDDAIQGKRPGVIVVHEWWGINNYVRTRTEQLAKLGYLAFAIDIYGKGNRAKDPKEAGALTGTFRSNRGLMRARANAGLEFFRNHSLVDERRIAAIGYCFGGTVVLEMARSGADLVGVVSFHGGLGTPNPGDARMSKARYWSFTEPMIPSLHLNRSWLFRMRCGRLEWTGRWSSTVVRSMPLPILIQETTLLKGRPIMERLTNVLGR